MKILPSFLLMLATMTLSLADGFGQTLTWNPNNTNPPTGGATNWSSSAFQWWNGTANQAYSTSSVIFGAKAPAGSYDVTLGAGFMVNDLTADPGSGNTLTLRTAGANRTLTVASGTTVSVTSGTLSLRSNGNNILTLSVNAGGTWTKNGAGTLWLESNLVADLKASVEVKAGTFLLSADTVARSRHVSVETATLAGSGNLRFVDDARAYELSLGAGGILAPGDQEEGIFTITDGNLTLADATARLRFDLAAPASTTDDLISLVDSNAGGFGGNLTLDGILEVNPLAGFGAGTYDLIAYTGVRTGTLNLSGLSEDFLGEIIYNDAAKLVQLQVTAVPEPATWGLLGAASVVLLLLRRPHKS